MNDDTPYTDEMLDLMESLNANYDSFKYATKMIAKYQELLRQHVNIKKLAKYNIKNIHDRVTEIYDEMNQG